MTLKRSHVAIVAVAMAIGLVVYFKRGTPAGPMKAADDLVNRGVAAIESKNVDDAMDLVASDYAGTTTGDDELTKKQLRRYLAVMMLRRDGIGITILNQDVQVHSQTSATIAITAVLTRGGVTGAAEGNVGARDIFLDIEVRDGQWQVVSSRQTSAL